MDTKLKLVWHKYFFPWNYPSNWIRNIKQFFRAIKNFIERGRYGVSTSDCWNLDGYLCDIFRNGIIKYKKDNCSYPAFITAEEWDKDIIPHTPYYASRVKLWHADVSM